MQLANCSAISLKQLLPQAKIIGSSDIFVSSCSGAWDECEANDLFVAVVDAEQDGHEFVKDAIHRGANSVLSERFLAVDCPQCIVEDSREAYAVLCQALAGLPSQRASTIGITGSQGKTVTCHLLQSILNEAGYSPSAVSSLSHELEQQSDLNQVSAPHLASTMRNLVDEGSDHLIVEMPSRLLAEKKLRGIQLDLAILTNLRREHLELHGSTENYIRAKMEMLDQLSDTGVAILNADDRATAKLLDRISVPALTFAVKQDAEVKARLIERCKSEQSFLLTAGSDSMPVRTSMIGDGHVYNCLAAATAAIALGIELPTIVRGLELAGHLPGRMERIECGQDFGVFVDVAQTPMQLAAALRTLQQTTDGKVLCVYAPEADANRSAKSDFGKTAEKLADRSFITSPTTHSRDQEWYHQVIDGYRNPRNAHLIVNRLDAIEYALGQAQPGDSVLIAGAGEKSIAIVGDESWSVSDKDVCKSWLYERPVREPEASIYRIDDYRE